MGNRIWQKVTLNHIHIYTFGFPFLSPKRTYILSIYQNDIDSVDTFYYMGIKQYLITFYERIL
jgi:hypothetical protein